MEKKQTTTRTLFSFEIEKNEEAHRMSVLLNMCGLRVDIKASDLIVEAIKREKKLKGKFAISDAIDLKYEIDEKYMKIQNKYDNQ